VKESWGINKLEIYPEGIVSVGVLEVVKKVFLE
jgi:hypothetical protein